MENYNLYKENVTINNCNGRLSCLYDTRDKIGNRIDKLCSLGYSVEKAEQEYDEVCEVIRFLCEFRRNNPGCLTEGDPGFRWN